MHDDRLVRVIVCQRGARHRYAIPRILEEAGMLAALYTDSCAYSAMGGLARGMNRLGICTTQTKALSSRVPNGVPKGKVYSSDRPLFRGQASADFLRWGLHDASVIYSMYGENFVFLKWAKAQGAKILVDVFVHPRTNRIVAAEEFRVLGREKKTSFSHEDAHSRRVFDLADILLCPSQWVAQGVEEFCPECRHKIRIVPYGSSVARASEINTPIPGTILFAGREPLRKGLHHLAEAAFLLNRDGFNVNVRVAGVSADEVEWMKYRSELTFLGKIPLAAMKQEYAKADIFVLPSLSEGQAGVLLEAMACGVPVIATRESGVDFEPGCGITIPSGDPKALAAALSQVLNDREHRDELARGALRQSEMFSMSEWGKRLVGLIRDLV